MNDVIIHIIKEWRTADTALKRELIRQIVKTGSQDGLKLLSQIVNRDRDIEIRQSARKAYNSLYNYCFNTISEDPNYSLQISFNDQELITMLGSSDPEQEMKALAFMQNHNSQAAFSFLRTNYDRYSDDRVKATLVKTIGVYGEAKDIPICYRFLEDASPRVRANAIEALEVINHPNTYMIFVQWLSDADNRVKANCIKALHKLGQQSVNRILDEMLHSEYVAYKESALYVISLSPSKQGLYLLQKFLTEEFDHSLAERALHIIHEFSNAEVPGAQEYLNEYYVGESYSEIDTDWNSDFNPDDLYSDDPEVVLRSLARVLENEFTNYGEELTNLLNVDSQDVRIISSVLRILGELEMVDCLDQVIVHLDSSENRVRANAVEAAGRLGYKEDDMIKFLEDENNRVRANAIVALSAHFDVSDAVNNMSRHSDSVFRMSLLYAIREIRSSFALDALNYLINDKEESVRNQAMEVLQFYEICGIEGATQILQKHGQSLYG